MAMLFEYNRTYIFSVENTQAWVACSWSVMYTMRRYSSQHFSEQFSSTFKRAQTNPSFQRADFNPFTFCGAFSLRVDKNRIAESETDDWNEGHGGVARNDQTFEGYTLYSKNTHN